jgi:hypothetical protein
MTVDRRRQTARLLAIVALLWLASTDTLRAAPDHTKVEGPDECTECHKYETEVWKDTHHFKTFTALPRKKEARTIAKAMGLKRIKSGSLCLNCHFTSQEVKGKVKPIAGITCESCHSASKDWIKLHSEFSGKKKDTESEEEAEQRWADSVTAGMIRPQMTYTLAKNCYGCHVVPQEELVNKGGHAAGSAFELVSWSQGEVRHNLWYTEGKDNKKAEAGRKRMMYTVGLAVELETAVRAVGKATEKAKYAVAMAKRVQLARKRMRQVARAAGVPELLEILRASQSARLKLNNDADLTAVADKIADAAQRFSEKYDGTQMAAIDDLIPAEDKYKGKPSR